MYNKIFTKILDSSIWLESNPTRIVWMTLLAAMDENGFAQFASVANLAHRARVELADGEAAVKCLEAPDINSSDPENEGRRIERVSGGWIVLNAEKYRLIVTRAVAQEQNRERVARFRAKKRLGNGGVTTANVPVTPSEALADTESPRQPSVASAPSDELKKPRIPTLEEWIAHCHDLSPQWPRADVEAAWHHYDSIGWKKGKNPIVRWKGAAATCHNNWKRGGFGQRTFGQPAPQFPMPKLAN